jgi:hypothetical protein
VDCGYCTCQCSSGAPNETKRVEKEAKEAENQQKQLERAQQVKAVNNKHQGSKQWFHELMYKVSPMFHLSSTEDIQLTRAKCDGNNNKPEKDLFNFAKEKELSVDLSLSEAQEKSLAWTKDKTAVSKLVQPQPRQQKSPPEVNISHRYPSTDPIAETEDYIPHDLLQEDEYDNHNLLCFLRVGMEWLESETYKSLITLSFQVIRILLYLRATNPEVYDCMESHHPSCHLAEMKAKVLGMSVSKMMSSVIFLAQSVKMLVSA